MSALMYPGDYGEWGVRLLVIRGWLDWQELAEARESLTKRFSEKHKSGPSAVAAHSGRHTKALWHSTTEHRE